MLAEKRHEYILQEFVEADTDGKVYWSLEFSRIEV